MAVELLDRSRSLGKTELAQYQSELNRLLKQTNGSTKVELIFSKEHGNHDNVLEKCEIILFSDGVKLYCSASDWTAAKSYKRALARLKRLMRSHKEKIITKKRSNHKLNLS
jgi:ribosome-associated translation inhibitor RaiA